jgi:hypothetical protein
MARRFITVAEVDPFPATAKRVGLTESARQEITLFLAYNTEVGDLIPGTGGLRKLRWAGMGKGKSGGYRVVYYFFNESVPLYLLAIYAKNERIDLTPQQKARLTDLAEHLKALAKAPPRAKRRIAR